MCCEAIKQTNKQTSEERRAGLGYNARCTCVSTLCVSSWSSRPLHRLHVFICERVVGSCAVRFFSTAYFLGAVRGVLVVREITRFAIVEPAGSPTTGQFVFPSAPPSLSESWTLDEKRSCDSPMDELLPATTALSPASSKQGKPLCPFVCCDTHSPHACW